MGQLTSNNDKTRHKVLGIMTVDDITLSQGNRHTFAHGGKNLTGLRESQPYDLEFCHVQVPI